MEREIKFRGISEISGKWVYGYLIRDRDDKSILVRVEKINKPAPDGGFDFNVPRELATVVKTKTIGQYTGLKDKNGKEIYEGDIIKLDRNTIFNLQLNELIAVVIYDDDNARFWIKSDTIDTKYFTIQDLSDFEVIGNIHETPELTKIIK